MGVDALELEGGHGCQLSQEGGRFGVPNAQASHSGVDLEVDFDRGFALYGQGVQTLALVEGADGGGQIVLDQECVLFGQERTEDEDRPACAHVADLGRLGGVGHGKAIDAALH